MKYPEILPLDKTANITPTTIKIKNMSSHLIYTPFVEIICLLLILYFIAPPKASRTYKAQEKQ